MSQFIIDFQKNNGLTPDGQIGKQTLLKIKEVLKIDTIEQLSHFMGQCDHESGGFTILSENLNYSSDGLKKIFGKYFPNNLSESYARNPHKIANRVYANRMGNGDENSGDGWKHRGFGPIQLTGKNIQDSFADYIKDNTVKINPELIATKYGFESAKYFFDLNKLWKYANTVDSNSILTVSRCINLGNPNSKSTPIGLDDRTKKTLFYYNLLKK